MSLPQNRMDFMKSTRYLIPLLGITLLASAGSAFAQRYDGPPAFRYDGDGGAERAMEQRGYVDGTRGADRDFQNHRRPDVNNRDEFRNPNFIPGWAQQEYREGFRRGYYREVQSVYYGRHDGDDFRR